MSHGRQRRPGRHCSKTLFTNPSPTHPPPLSHKQGLLNVLALGLASVAQRIPPGGQSFLEHQPQPDKDFSALDAADVGTAPLCLEFHPGDLQEYLQEHEREVPTLVARWGASWAE